MPQPNHAPRRWWPKRRRTIAALLALLVCAGLIVRLSLAPLNLPFGTLLAERIEAQSNLSIDIGAVALQLGAGHLDLVLRDVTAEDDALAASIAAIHLRQGFASRDIVVNGPALRIAHRAGGTLAVPTPGPGLAALRTALYKAHATLTDAGMRSLSVLDGDITFAGTGEADHPDRVLRHVGATVTLEEGPGLSASGSFVGAVGPAGFDLTWQHDVDGDTLTLAGDAISPLDLAPIKPIQSGFALAPRLDVAWDAEGAPLSADMSLEIGTGLLKFGRDPLRELDWARADLNWRAEAPDIEVSAVRVVAGATSMTVTGTLTPVADGPWRWALGTRDAVFDQPDITAPPVYVTRIEGEGRIDFPAKLIHADRIHGVMPAGRVDAVVTFDLNEGGPYVSGSAHVGASMIPAMLGAWPIAMGYEPRKAIVETVWGGLLREADITFALTKPDFDGDPDTHSTLKGAMSVDAAFFDATLATADLPLAIQRARGTLRMRDKTLTAVVRSGVIGIGGDPTDADASGDVLLVEDARMTIQRLDERPVIASAKLVVRAPMTAAVRLAELFGVTEISGTPLSPDDVSGSFRATLTVKTPLGPNVPLKDRAWSVEARLFDVSSNIPIGGQVFDNANVEVAINARRLAARGRAEIEGLVVDVNYSELFSGAGERSTAARVVLSDADRKAKGFDTGDMVTGPVVVTLEAANDEERLLTADLTDAAVLVPGIKKDKGEPLSAEALVVTDGDRTTVRDISVDGSGIEIEGKATLSSDMDLQSAEFSRIALSEGDDARLSIDRRKGAYHLKATAKEFDARPLIDTLRSSLSGGDDDANLPDAVVDVTAARVRLKKDAVMTDLSLKATQDAGKLDRLAASGKIGGTNAGTFGVTYGEDGSRKRLRADVTSLGQLLASLGIYDRLRDGRTKVDAVMGDDGVLRGRLTASDFIIENEEALNELVKRARRDEFVSLERNVQPQALSNGTRVEGGIPFNELIVDFERRGDTIVIREAILRGSVMGGTAEGVVDLGAGLMRLNGTFIPAYGVNNLFGRLPIVGNILGGGNKGGLIGVTFRLSGPVDDPKVAVNPISAIAPGIFRRIFEFR